MTETPFEYEPGWRPWPRRKFILDLHLFSPIGGLELEVVALMRNVWKISIPRSRKYQVPTQDLDLFRKDVSCSMSSRYKLEPEYLLPSWVDNVKNALGKYPAAVYTSSPMTAKVQLLPSHSYHFNTPLNLPEYDLIYWVPANGLSHGCG